MKMRYKIFVGLIVLLSIFWIGLRLLFQPSHDRTWEVGQEQLPQMLISGDEVIINNYRDFDWHDDGSVEPLYVTETFNLSQIDTVDVFISHFDDFEGLAHIFLSFGFADGTHAVVSLETRRELGEEFSPTFGILRQFEIIYVVGSEEDIVGLRTDVRGERVYLYPTVATPEKARSLFLALAEDINNVHATPAMYNTLTHNCTNELSRRVEDIADVTFPLTWKSVLPGYFDEVLYDMELIRHDKNFEDVKREHLIKNSRVDRRQETYSRDLRTEKN